MEKYGFVYVWYDRKHKRYYVGSHWGREDDGYICSSRWMRKAYRRRPSDFRRKIIKRITSSRQDLLLEENRWLKMIRDDELGKRFYNLTNHLNGHWSTNENKRMTVGEKISQHHKQYDGWGQWSKGRIFSEETREKMSKAATGRVSPRKGVALSDETKKRVSLSKMGQGRDIPLSTEHRASISLGSKGKIFSEEHRRNISISKTGKKPNRIYHMSEETKRKISETLKKKKNPEVVMENVRDQPLMGNAIDQQNSPDSPPEARAAEGS